MLSKSDIFLLYDVTRGVDIGAKEEIYRIVLELAKNGAAILYYTTDMEELLRLCHRVAVFHDGFVVRLLAREELSDTALVSAAFGREEAPPDEHRRCRPGARDRRSCAFQCEPRPRSAVATVVPLVVLAVELAYFFGRSPASFGRSYLLNDLSTAMPLILVATGQAIVIISGGIDISVGGTISLVSALAATTFTSSDPNVLGWSVLLVLLGLGIGAVNGFLIGVLGFRP